MPADTTIGESIANLAVSHYNAKADLAQSTHSLRCKMIRAIVKDGKIQTLGPLPSDWTDGQELVVQSIGKDPSQGWTSEVDAAMSEIPREDHQRLLAAVNAHRAEQKDLVRREMKGQS